MYVVLQAKSAQHAQQLAERAQKAEQQAADLKAQVVAAEAEKKRLAKQAAAAKSDAQVPTFGSQFCHSPAHELVAVVANSNCSLIIRDSHAVACGPRAPLWAALEAFL